MSSNPNDPHPTYGSYEPPTYSSYEQQPGASSFSAGEPFGGAQSTPQNAMMTEADYRQLGQEPPLSQPLYGAKPITAYIRFWKKYVRFKGYASRSEYWWPQLINTLTCLVLFSPAIVGLIISNNQAQQTFKTTGSYPTDPYIPGFAIISFFATFLFLLAAAVPTLSSGWRRIQDAGMHGALVFLSFVPYLGGLINFVLCLLPTKLAARNPGYDDNTGD
ncbi:DUF805 domain-containing protein [Brevibacterium sp. Marseille-P9724]|uniref:DUF805 domain-containing protein n=1 Tax=Brevibacterium sp. Marseille-P9724 TaxID=2614125 RepID=UPI00125F20FC|nr:DUF805 domain-containing protein [Brevibacterium sp. Marseille-P9724]